MQPKDLFRFPMISNICHILEKLIIFYMFFLYFPRLPAIQEFSGSNFEFLVARYAIGGLAGGEDKDSFWRVVAQCTAGLPEDKP